MGKLKKILAEQQKTMDRLRKNTRYPGTDFAETDCELCGAAINLPEMTIFMYPEMTSKYMCNDCGRKEHLRLDYSNKN